MREKNLLHLFLIMNVALAGAFVVYLFLSSNRHPRVTSGSFLPAGRSNATPTLAAATRTNAPLVASNPPAATNAAVGPAATNATPAQPVFVSQRFTWQHVGTPEYKAYFESLRAVGCPEDKVRYIILSDINELFNQKRVREAITNDITWWKAEPQRLIASTLAEKGRALEEERRSLIEKLLGPEAVETENSEALLWSSVQLTGPVLGSLAPETHNTVQEICSRSIERHQNAFWARANEGQPINQVEMARLREQTRADLRKVLDADGMEEFLLRYSHNAQQLRYELRGIDPGPEEFRKIFRAVDALDHQLQIEYGGIEALSAQQRERHERQRDAAIKEALGAGRYQAWLITKDPLYRQAQATAMQYGAPSKVVMPIYQMVKATETRRQKIIGDAALSPQEKSVALNTVNQEHLQSVQRLVSEALTVQRQ